MVDLVNAKTPGSNLLTGGQPTVEQLGEVKAAGYRTIINLRGVGEAGTDVEPELVRSLGLVYHHLPIHGAQGVNFDSAAQFAEILEAAEGPVVVHCASGNRVGALFALKAYKVDGKSADDALSEGVQTGLTGLEGHVRQLLGL